MKRNAEMIWTYKINRNLLVLIMCILLAVGAAFLGLSSGSGDSDMRAFVSSVWKGESTSTVYRIIMYSRLPRVIGALLAGSAFSVSGVILQSVLQNPLASPNIIGINNGAGIMVLICSAFFPGMYILLPFAAFLGAMVTALLVYSLSMWGGNSRITLVLTGIAISSVLGAGMNCILILYPDAYVGASSFLVGGLSGITLRSLRWPAVYIVLGVAAAVLFQREMQIISLGTVTARTLGIQVQKIRFLLIMISAILSGAAVSFAGLLGFAGLIVPHAIRFLLGNSSRFLLPSCIFGGAAFVTFCDWVSRTAFAPYEIPVGILLSFIGGPFFICLIIRNRRNVNA